MKRIQQEALAALRRIVADPKTPAPMRGVKLPQNPRLLGGSYKIDKGEARGILTAVLYLSPSTESGANLCPWATAECSAACLGHSSGQMIFSTSRNSRLWKTALFLYARTEFRRLLCAEIAAHQRKADRLGMTCAVRLNGTSDIVNARDYSAAFFDEHFYDYTKNSKRRTVRPHDLAQPYHITLSYSGHNRADCVAMLRDRGNVAVVFDTPKGEPLPETWEGFPVLDADADDARFLDPLGHVAGLRFKGPRRLLADAGTFVERTMRATFKYAGRVQPPPIDVPWIERTDHEV